MAEDPIDRRIARRDALKEKRRNLEAFWGELTDVLAPWRGGFQSDDWHADGIGRELENHRDRFDSTPIQAATALANAIGGLLRPRDVQWVFLRAADDRLNEDDLVKRAIEIAERRLIRAIYDPAARFTQASGEADYDLVTLGTSVTFIGEAASRDRLFFRCYPLRDVLIARNAAGVVDTIYITMKNLTVRQAAQMWGEENLGRDAKQQLKDGKLDETQEYLWTVQPRSDRDRGRQDSLAMPWMSTVDEVSSRHNVEESGFEEFPFAVPVWGTTSGESPYGARAPGMIALPDAETLQAQGKTLLVGGQKRVSPPMWVTSDAAVSKVRTRPDGLTVIDARAMRDLGRLPFGVLESGANIPIGREMQNDTREQIWGAFFRNVLQIPVNRPQMTATEIVARQEEFLRVVGPVFGALETDDTAVKVERAFSIMLRGGAFPELEEIMPGEQIEFRYESPVLRARKTMELAGLARSFELLAPLAQVQPEIYDNWDGDRIARDTPDLSSYPQRWLKPLEVVQANRQAAAQQAAQASQKQELSNTFLTASEVARNVAPLAGEIVNARQQAPAP